MDVLIRFVRKNSSVVQGLQGQLLLKGIRFLLIIQAELFVRDITRDEF